MNTKQLLREKYPQFEEMTDQFITQLIEKLEKIYKNWEKDREEREHFIKEIGEGQIEWIHFQKK